MGEIKLTKICPDCNTDNLDSAGFCQSCGSDLAKLNETETNVKSRGGLGGFWNKQSGKSKAAIGVVGICCIGLILIILIAGMASPDKTAANGTNTTTAVSATPTNVTISQLYNNGVTKGTLVKVTGTVIQSDGNRLRIKNTNNDDIMVEGSDLNGYEDQSVTIIGTFSGPSSYDTAMGSSRTVPFITDAKMA